MDESKKSKFIELCKENNIEYSVINRCNLKSYFFESSLKELMEISKKINYFDFALDFFVEVLENE